MPKNQAPLHPNQVYMNAVSELLSYFIAKLCRALFLSPLARIISKEP